jgi:hypothetical protein
VQSGDTIHLVVQSAFRACGINMAELFNSASWAFYVQVAVPMRLPDAGRLYGQLRQAGDSLIILCGTDRV